MALLIKWIKPFTFYSYCNGLHSDRTAKIVTKESDVIYAECQCKDGIESKSDLIAHLTTGRLVNPELKREMPSGKALLDLIDKMWAAYESARDNVFRARVVSVFTEKYADGPSITGTIAQFINLASTENDQIRSFLFANDDINKFEPRIHPSTIPIGQVIDFQIPECYLRGDHVTTPNPNFRIASYSLRTK